MNSSSAQAGAPRPAKIELVFVVAVAENGVIGRDNALPWKLKADMQRFRAATINRPVIMGRRTYDSIGVPLKQRTNIVVTRKPDFAVPGIVVVSDLSRAVTTARGDALRRGATEITIIGGQDIFAQLMGVVDRIELTRVHAAPEGDVFFPATAEAEWRREIVRTVAADAQNSAPTTFEVWHRA